MPASAERVAAVIVKDRALALIERRVGKEVYYLFPGGAVEAGESNRDALVREVLEETGLAVVIRRLLAEVVYKGKLQRYYLVDVVGGEFGRGYGAELSFDENSESGSYQPVWLQVDELLDRPVYPRGVADLVVHAAAQGWPRVPLRIADTGRS